MVNFERLGEPDKEVNKVLRTSDDPPFDPNWAGGGRIIGHQGAMEPKTPELVVSREKVIQPLGDREQVIPQE